jgi:hypothetical protein
MYGVYRQWSTVASGPGPGEQVSGIGDHYSTSAAHVTKHDRDAFDFRIAGRGAGFVRSQERFKSDRYRLDDGLGLRAQAAFGPLVRAEDGWRGLFRPRDYA